MLFLLSIREIKAVEKALLILMKSVNLQRLTKKPGKDLDRGEELWQLFQNQKKDNTKALLITEKHL
jgi:hypothetical protein